MDESTVEKIAQLTPEIGITYSGMGPDFRVLTRKARKETQVYYRTYHELVPCSQLVRETATVMQEFTQRGGVRPFGVSLLVAGYDSNGPQARREGGRDGTSHHITPPSRASRRLALLPCVPFHMCSSVPNAAPPPLAPELPCC